MFKLFFDNKNISILKHFTEPIVQRKHKYVSRHWFVNEPKFELVN